MQSVQAHDPGLLEVGEGRLFTAGGWTSWSLSIALTVIGFPHMLVRLMAGRDDDALKGVSRLYPFALILLWVPAVLFGVWGAAQFPGLDGRASDEIFSLMSAAYLPTWLASVSFLAVLAAVMSTLDAQILTLSSMLVRDVLDVVRPAPEDPTRGVRWGRAFGVLVAVGVYGLSVIWGSSVFEIASYAFAGYVTLTPTLFLGVRWRRFTAAGAIASLLTSNLVLGLMTARLIPSFGFLPVFWAFVVGLAVAIVVSLATRAVSYAQLDAAFGDS